MYVCMCVCVQAEVGIIAINDGFYLENAVYFILKKYFRSLPCYISLVELFQQVCSFTRVIYKDDG